MRWGREKRAQVPSDRAGPLQEAGLAAARNRKLEEEGGQRGHVRPQKEEQTSLVEVFGRMSRHQHLLLFDLILFRIQTIIFRCICKLSDNLALFCWPHRNRPVPSYAREMFHDVRLVASKRLSASLGATCQDIWEKLPAASQAHPALISLLEAPGYAIKMAS